VDPSIEVRLEIPDEDIFELLATLQPVFDRNSIPHYKSQLWAFSNKLSEGRVPRGSLRVPTKALFDLLFFFQVVLPNCQEIRDLSTHLSAAGNIDSYLSSESLGMDVLDENTVVSRAGNFHTAQT
jgi:hypothetical protein